MRALVIRTFAQEKAAIIAEAGCQLHVINALTDEEHPCQALADAFQLRERWGQPRPEGRVRRRRQQRGDVLGARHADDGVTLHAASPAGYELPDHVIDAAARIARDGAEVRRFTDPRQAVAGVDAVYTDVWTSMGEEAEADQRRRTFARYQVNGNLMLAANSNALFMHACPRTAVKRWHPR